MAPTAKEKVVPAGFQQSQDGKKIQCLLCTAISPTRREAWIGWPSLSSHLKSAGHAHAVQNEQMARAQAAEIEKTCQEDLAQRREAEMQFSALRDVQIPGEQHTSRVQSSLETELWDELEMDLHGAGFDLGIDKTTQQYNTLCNETNSLWNAGILSQNSKFSLGEGNDLEDLFQEDDEDAFLAEIMRNAGGSWE
jgi:hypothetical protein